MKAVILAAGEGIRLRPLTYNRSKHLLPIGGKPLLEYVLNTVKDSGIKDVLLIVGYKGELIQKTFGDGSRLDLKISYKRQPKVIGTGNAIALAEDYTNDEDFFVIYGDLYVDLNVAKKIIQNYEKRKSNILAVVEVEQTENYGIVKIKTDNKIVNIVEKPKPEKAPSNLANAGVYVFTPKIFEEIRRAKISIRGEIEVTDAIKQLLKKAEDFYTVKIDRESWLDIGRPWDLLDANERELKKATLSVEGIVEDGAHLIGSVVVKKEARIKSGVYIEGPVLISEGSQIGPNCYVRPYTSIGENVKIGNGCEIKNSIIMNGSHVPHISYVGDSIIGENCNLGAGTVTANIRLDEKPVKVSVKDKIVNSGKRKLGAIIGDNVKIGINVNFMPGVKIGPNCRIGAGINVHRDIPPNTKVLERRQLEFEGV